MRTYIYIRHTHVLTHTAGCCNQSSRWASHSLRLWIWAPGFVQMRGKCFLKVSTLQGLFLSHFQTPPQAWHFVRKHVQALKNTSIHSTGQRIWASLGILVWHTCTHTGSHNYHLLLHIVETRPVSGSPEWYAEHMRDLVCIITMQLLVSWLMCTVA